MNLVWFHRILIGTAILFFLGFAAWQLKQYFDGGAVSDLLFGLGSAAAGILLAVYLQRLKRFLNLPEER